jgi:hypothetical protein
VEAQAHAAQAQHRVLLVEPRHRVEQHPLLRQLRRERRLVAVVQREARSSTDTSCIKSSRLGRNSRSGGSMRRMVTGHPFIALKRPAKVGLSASCEMGT